MQKARDIFLYCIPVVIMIGLIPLVPDEYILSFIYLFFIGALLVYKKEKNDALALAVGLIAVSAFELLFVSTGVESFSRHTLFGLIPIWLPLLWAYAFVTIKRSLRILDARS